MELLQSKGEKTVGHIISPALHSVDLNSSGITLPTFGKPLGVFLIATNPEYIDDFINSKRLCDPFDRKLVIAFNA